MWDKINYPFPNLKSHPIHCDACINFDIIIESRLIHIYSLIQTFKLLVHMAISTYTILSITIFFYIWHNLVASLWNILKKSLVFVYIWVLWWNVSWLNLHMSCWINGPHDITLINAPATSKNACFHTTLLVLGFERYWPNETIDKLKLSSTTVHMA